MRAWSEYLTPEQLARVPEDVKASLQQYEQMLDDYAENLDKRAADAYSAVHDARASVGASIDNLNSTTRDLRRELDGMRDTLSDDLNATLATLKNREELIKFYCKR